MRRTRLCVCLSFALCFMACYIWSRGNTVPVSAMPHHEATMPPAEAVESDYSRFAHTNQYHARMPCLLCHQRNSNSARMSFPGSNGHSPCVGCHQLQFSDNSSPICTICHTDPGSGAMKRFPGLRSFGRKFDHSRHRGVNCGVCHKSSRGGVAFSIPAGGNAHSTCFQCHTASSRPSMSSCSSCHQPGRLIRTSESAPAFRMNFSHARHGQSGLSCASCHSVRPGAPTGRQVSSPAASMHFPPSRAISCGGCHNGTKGFGANDFASCKRCHKGNSFGF